MYQSISFLKMKGSNKNKKKEVNYKKVAIAIIFATLIFTFSISNNVFAEGKKEIFEMSIWVYSRILIHETDHRPGRKWSLFSNVIITVCRPSFRPSVRSFQNFKIDWLNQWIGWPSGSFIKTISKFFFQNQYHSLQ